MSDVIATVAARGNAGDALSATDLASLCALLLVPGTLPLPADHPIFARLRTTAAGAVVTDRESLAALVRLCVHLAACPAHRATALELLEACHDALEGVVLADVQLLARTPRVAPSDILCDLLLTLTLGSGCTLRGAQAAESLAYSIYAVLETSIALVKRTAGLAPGLASSLEGQPELLLQTCTRLIGILHELLLWPTFEAIAANTRGKWASDTNMRTLSAQFHEHVSQCGAVVMEDRLFDCLTQLYARHRDIEPYAAQVARAALLLSDAMLSLTGRVQTRMRRALVQSGVVRGCFAPLLAGTLALRPPAIPQLGGDLRALATVCFACGAAQTEVLAQAATLIPPLAQLLASLPMLKGSLDRPTFVMLSAQLVRLAINARWSDLALRVQQTLPPCLDAATQGALAAALADPMRVSLPVDMESPCWSVLGFLLVLPPSSTTAPPAPIPGDQRRESGSGRGRGRSGRRGRRGGHRRGGWRGGKRGRPNQRQRARYERLREILSRRAAPPASREEAEQRQLEQLVSDSSSASEEEEEEEEGGTVTEGVAADSLAEWRTQTAPLGIPRRYICDLSLRFMDSCPMISPQGYTFDGNTIMRYLQTHKTCPLSGEPLHPNDLLRDTDLQEEIKKVRFRYINLL